jgi:F0F1-type ATP synthase membrane subunit b/b'
VIFVDERVGQDVMSVALREAQARNEELEQRQAQLEAELQEARELMQERDDEIESLA